MTTQPMTTHERLMNEAYDNGKHATYEAFLDTLDMPHRRAVVLGNLNYQVENGGFSQWILNGYSGGSVCLFSALTKIGTPAALAVKLLVKSAIANSDEDDEAVYNKLDTAYYKLSAALMADAEVYLAGLVK